MQYFSLRRLSGRIFWAFLGLAILMLATGIAASILLTVAASNADEQLLRNRQLGDIKAVSELVEQKEQGVEVLIKANVTGVFDEVKGNYLQSLTSFQEYGRSFPPGEAASVKFNELKNNYTSVAGKFLVFTFRRPTAEEERQIYLDIKTTLETLRGQVAAFLQERQQVADSTRMNEASVVNNTRTGYILASILLFILATCFAFLIARSIARPLAVLSEHLNRVSKGDLATPMNPRGPDEFVKLSLIFNRTIANLKLALARIQSQAWAIQQTAQQLNSSSDGQATSLSEQAVGLSQVSTTIAELSDTSEHIADSAALVADSANKALESASEGYYTMLGASETMSEIRAKVNLIADRIVALNSVAQRIREITLLIDMLANETHLLALNAAIESAGAGEEGARFAVVAGHVRKLSQRSRGAAVEIQQLVSQIQHAAASSVMATEEGTKVVALGDKMVNDSLRANEAIINQVSQTTQLAQAISQATEQQRIASTQVAGTMRQLSKLSLDISQGSQQFLVSSDDLNQVVSQLNGVVNAFVVQKAEIEAELLETGLLSPAADGNLDAAESLTNSEYVNLKPLENPVYQP